MGRGHRASDVKPRLLKRDREATRRRAASFVHAAYAAWRCSKLTGESTQRRVSTVLWMYQPSMNGTPPSPSACDANLRRASNSLSAVAKKLSHIAFVVAQSPTLPMEGRTAA